MKPRSLFITLTLLLSISVFSENPRALAKGGNTSGGGTLISRQAGEPAVLLDLLGEDPTFQDDYSNTSRRELRTLPFQVLGKAVPGHIRKVRLTDQVAYSLVRNRLNLWHMSSPVVIQAIESSLASMQAWAIDAELIPQKGYVVSKTITDSFPGHQIFTAIAYGKDVDGIVISIRAWNAAGLYTQAGLLIHEALRDIQVQEDGMNEQVLQSITAQIMLTEPKSGETLDQVGVFGQHLDSMIRYSPDATLREIQSICSGLVELNQNMKLDEATLVAFSKACPQTGSTKTLIQAVEDLYLILNGKFDQLYQSAFVGKPGLQNSLRHLHDRARSTYWGNVSAALNTKNIELRHLGWQFNHGFITQ